MTNTVMRERWIRALRSGEYTQGEGSLKAYNFGGSEYEFCCLGVLCDLVDSTKWDREATTGNIVFEGKADYPPTSILEMVGLTLEDAQLLATFNDSDGYDFEDIARYLEDGTRIPSDEDEDY